MIRVTYLGPIKTLTGCVSEEYELSGPLSVRSLIEHVASRHGVRARSEILQRTADGPFFYQIIINGNNIYSTNGMETRICAGDNVLISVPLTGG